MRTIGYIGNFRAPFSTENELRIGFESLGVRVMRIQEDEAPWETLAPIAEQYGLDAIVWTHTHDYASGPTEDRCYAYLRDMATRDIPTVGLHLDRWIGLEREVQLETEPFFRQTIVCTADGDPTHREVWSKHGIVHRWLPPAVNHAYVYRGVRVEEFTHQVAFVGSWQAGYHHEWLWRKQLIHWLQRTYGEHSNLIGFYPRPGQHAVRGPALNNLYASVGVVVGDSCLAGGITHYWSDRIPETCGRGGVLVHPDVDGLDDEFPVELWPMRFELGDFDSLRAAIDTVLGMDPEVRASRIDASMDHVRAHHTYAVRARQLLDMIDEVRR